MNLSNFGATCRTFLGAVALAFLAVPATAQVVERGRTWDDLVASHPCASGLTGRIARVTDCDAADDVGDGGGAFNCWVSCDGSAPWVTQAIGAGGGGLPGADEVTESMLKAVDAAGDEECLTFESTVGDFEWQTCATGNILGAPLTATDNLPLCTDGTGGSTIGACTVAAFPLGSAAAPSISFDGDPNTGIYSSGADAIAFSTQGTQRINMTTGNIVLSSSFGITGNGTQSFAGYKVQLFPRTNGAGAPLVHGVDASSQWGTNEGATAEVYVTLPPADYGLHFHACVQDADGFRFTANTGDTIRVIDKVTAAAGYISSTTIGSCISLVAINPTEWLAHSINGVWTDGTFSYDDTSLTTP